jgi:hypothetical protein
MDPWYPHLGPHQPNESLNMSRWQNVQAVVTLEVTGRMGHIKRIRDLPSVYVSQYENRRQFTRVGRRLLPVTTVENLRVNGRTRIQFWEQEVSRIVNGALGWWTDEFYGIYVYDVRDVLSRRLLQSIREVRQGIRRISIRRAPFWDRIIQQLDRYRLNNKRARDNADYAVPLLDPQHQIRIGRLQ